MIDNLIFLESGKRYRFLLNYSSVGRILDNTRYQGCAVSCFDNNRNIVCHSGYRFITGTIMEILLLDDTIWLDLVDVNYK